MKRIVIACLLLLFVPAMNASAAPNNFIHVGDGVWNLSVPGHFAGVLKVSLYVTPDFLVEVKGVAEMTETVGNTVMGKFPFSANGKFIDGEFQVTFSMTNLVNLPTPTAQVGTVNGIAKFSNFTTLGGTVDMILRIVTGDAISYLEPYSGTVSFVSFTPM